MVIPNIKFICYQFNVSKIKDTTLPGIKTEEQQTVNQDFPELCRK